MSRRNILKCEDILYHIRQHLPFVDRRELSLVCRAFREPLREVFQEYTRTLEIGNDYCCLLDDVVYWLLIVHTPSEKTSYLKPAMGYWCDDSLTVVDGPMKGIGLLKFLDTCSVTDIQRAAYFPATRSLYVRNWEVFVKRRAIIFPDFFMQLNKRYIVENDPIVRNSQIGRAMETLQSMVTIYARRGITLVPCTKPLLSLWICENNPHFLLAFIVYPNKCVGINASK